MKPISNNQVNKKSLSLYDISDLGFHYGKYQACINAIDQNDLRKYNLKYPKGSDFHLHEELTPCPFEGDLLKAKIYLLLTNPWISPTSNPATHNLYVEGWSLANLSKESTSKWYRPRFKTLVDNPESENEWMRLSNKLAMIQAIPWASRKAKAIRLPSNSLMTDTVKELSRINQDSIFVVMRNKKFWMPALQDLDQSRVIINPNPRNSFITRGNFKNDWEKIKLAVASSESN